MPSDDDDAAPNAGATREEYIVHVRVHVRRQTIEEGYDLHDWDDRKEAEIETEKLDFGFQQTKGPSLDDVLGQTVDLAELVEERDAE